MRSETASAKHARKTHCFRGHPFSGENLYITPSTGARCCKICQKKIRREKMLATNGFIRPDFKGEHNPKAKLTAQQVLEIRAKWSAGGITRDALSRAYGVYPTTISRILLNKGWKDLIP
jgi:hypothetical protein